MTLDQLKMLVAIADSGSVLAAAEKLLRTQPTVSVGIQKLETSLGITLLDRSNYRVSLTPAGEQICQKARHILRQTNELNELARHLGTGKEAELSLAIEASCPMQLVLQMLTTAESKYPRTQLTLTTETLWGAIEKVKLTEADLAITPWFQDDDSLDSFPLTTSVLTTVAAPNFPPLISGQPLHRDDLRESVQVVVRDSSRQAPADKHGLLEGGRRWLVSDHETKKKIILAGMGWGRLQNHLITDELASGRLLPLSISEYQETMQIEIRMVRLRSKLPGPVASDLWNDFQQTAGLQ